MNVYGIVFEDRSIYIGATKSDIKVRIGNHKSKWRSGKYQIRKIYQKMSEFKGEFEVLNLGFYKDSFDAYEAEKGYIALFKGSGLLNNSTGGAISSKGKKHTKETIEKQRLLNLKNEYFEVINRTTKELIYKGNSQTDAAKASFCTIANISHGLKRVRNGAVASITNPSKFIFRITGGDLSQ